MIITESDVVASYLLGLVSFNWVNKKDIFSSEYIHSFKHYSEFIEKKILDDAPEAQSTIRQLIGGLMVDEDGQYLTWKAKFEFMYCSIFAVVKKMMIMGEEEDKDYESIIIERCDNLDTECILAYFIGITHWINSDKRYWKHYDPQQQFLECIREEIAPEMEKERLLDMTYSLDYDPHFEDIRMKAYELIGVNKIIMEHEDPDEGDFDPDIRNFQKNYR